MIRLTGVYGSDIYVNTDNIIGIYKRTSDGYTNVDHGHDAYVVKESPEEVARKVLEYRLSMIRYEKAYAQVLKPDDADAEIVIDFTLQDLNFLAGLEEQKDG